MQYFVTITVVLTICASGSFGAPVNNNLPEKITIDQSQEGEWNVRADLKNFVFLIIPTSSQQNALSSTAETSTAGLLDLLLSKTHHGSKRNHVRRVRPHKNQDASRESTVESFLEAKTAPYHVDISQTKSHLLKEEILATQKPPQASPELTKILEKARTARYTQAFVLTVPEEDFVITKMEDSKKVVKKDGYQVKKVKKAASTYKPEKHELKLLGAMEQCGSGLFRDKDGICQIDK